MTETHLGGYVAGGDEATWFPDLWRWLVKEHGVGSVVDVGCGEGLSLDFFLEQGCRGIGVDGVPQPSRWIVEHDYSQGPLLFGNASEEAMELLAQIEGQFDLAWSCEFVEHVEEEHVMNFVSTFMLAPLVLMTHADPGQEGYHHVNCRTAAYWVAVMAAAGYRLDRALTDETRKLSAMNTSPWNHYARSGLAFVR